jgi:hypothetical protein
MMAKIVPDRSGGERFQYFISADTLDANIDLSVTWALSKCSPQVNDTHRKAQSGIFIFNNKSV